MHYARLNGANLQEGGAIFSERCGSSAFCGRIVAAISLLTLVIFAALTPISNVGIIQPVHALPAAPLNSAVIAPTKFWGPFEGSTGDVQIDIDRIGLAVRVEIPREFLQGVVRGENDTHFIQSDIRNDYYYYNVVDESAHWSHEENRTVSDAPCWKPNFAIYDPNAPWCVEIWNYLNGTFLNFTAPRFVRFKELNAPSIAGVYNFTVFVANHTNSLHLPDFLHAWNKTLLVPISMSDNPASISGSIYDDDAPGLPTIYAKGVVFAKNTNTRQVARAFVNATTGRYNLTGLAPGDYQVQASAGVFRPFGPSGPARAYSLTDPQPFPNVQRGQSFTYNIPLHEAPKICDTGDESQNRFIVYENVANPNVHIRSLTDDAYLINAGFKVLNITVEATDSSGRVFGRNMTTSLDSAFGDSLIIMTGLGSKYVNGDPTSVYGTEFAGLPEPGTTGYHLNLKVNVTGYLQKSSAVVTISTGGGFPNPQVCNKNAIPSFPVRMVQGGVISGLVRFQRDQLMLETPDQAQISLGLGTTPTAFFGGNIVIQAFDHSGNLRGVTVINGTNADGTTIYHAQSTVRFYVIGFSEFYYRTWGGTWGFKDNGLPDDSGYTVKVLIRGYEQYNNPSFSVSTGSNVSISPIVMLRGGAIAVGVFSTDNRPGTRAIQASLPWRFLNLSISVRARVYFYGLGGCNLPPSLQACYVERLMVLKSALNPNGVDTRTSFTVLFTGMNWSLREIWFFGLNPSHITSDTYNIKAYTLGYVQQRDVTNNAGLVSLTRSGVTLFYANEVDLSGPIFQSPLLFSKILEHDHSRGVVYSGSTLMGALNANVTSGTPSVFFKVFGFGATEVNGTFPFEGQGHFFYVDTDGKAYFDYGLDVAAYTGQIPEFGFNRHFMQLRPIPTLNFTDLFLESGVIVAMIAMARVTQGVPSDTVSGWVEGVSVKETMPLSWVHVEAVNASFNRHVPTMDGLYDGPGALFLPEGAYQISFSVPFYKASNQTWINYGVNWNANYSLLPVEGLLCPIVNTGLPCDPPLEISASPAGGNSPAGALVLTARVMLRDSKNIVASYHWSASQGNLNSTTGPTVLWTPANRNDLNATIAAYALVNTGSSQTMMLTANYTISELVQPIPEFPIPPTILGGPILLLTVTLIAYRKQRHKPPPRPPQSNMVSPQNYTTY